MSILRLAASIALICSFLWMSPAAAEPVFIPGSRIGMAPPRDFVPSHEFNGFVSARESGSILIVEMPARAYSQIVNLSDARWASKAITVQSRTAMTIDSAQAVFIRGEQIRSGITLKKWIMIIGFGEFTAFVTAQIPATVGKERQAAIDGSLETIRPRAALTLEQRIAALPFDIGSTGKMRVLRVMAGNAIVLTRGPKQTITGAEQPMLIIARSFPGTSAARATAKAISRRTIKTLASLENITIERTGTVKFAGGDGFEIIAQARVGKTKEPVAVIQWLKTLDDGYLRIVGIAGTATSVADFNTFRKVRDGIRAR